MEILDKVAEIAGAGAAREAEKTMQPGASPRAQGAAAVLGCEGGAALAALVQEKPGSADAARNAGLQA